MASYNIKKIRTVGRPTKYEQALEHWATDIAQWMQNYMLKNDRIATGDSISSFEMLIADNEIILSAAASVAYALQGRGAGAFPDIAEIEKWIIAKPVEAYPDSKGRIPTLNELVFLISRKISEQGTDPPKLKPQNIAFIITQLGTKYIDTIGQLQAEELIQDMKDVFSRSNIYKNN